MRRERYNFSNPNDATYRPQLRAFRYTPRMAVAIARVDVEGQVRERQLNACCVVRMEKWLESECFA